MPYLVRMSGPRKTRMFTILVVISLCSISIHFGIRCDFLVKTDPSSYYQNGLVVDKNRSTSLITVIDGVDLTRCIQGCLLRPRCVSVNYVRRFLLCYLNFLDTIYEKNTFVEEVFDTSYNETFQALYGACAKLNCRLNERCQEGINGNYKCVISDCGQPPLFNNTLADMSNGIGVDSKVTYGCQDGFICKGKPYISCQPNGKWTHLNFTSIKDLNGPFYSIFTSRKSWFVAKTECERQGGYLAEIHSKKENDIIIELMKEKGINPSENSYLWLGANDVQTEGDWKWIKSQRYFRDGNYTNWSLANQVGEGDCLLIWNDYKWSNKRCADNHYFVCQRD